jgi:O-antigen ligase
MLTTSERIDVIVLACMPFVLYLFFFCIPFAKVLAGPAYVLYCLLYGIHLLLRKGRSYVQEPRAYYALLLLYLLFAASSLLYTPDIENGLKSLKTQVGLVLIPVLVETVSSRNRARLCLYAYAFGGTVLALITIYQGIILHVYRPPNMLHPVHEGHLLLFTTVTTLALIISDKKRLHKLILLSIFFFLIFALYLNGTRSAWAALGVVLVTAPLLMVGLKLKIKFLYFIALAFAALLLCYSSDGQKRLSEAVIDINLLQKSQFVAANGALTSLGARSEMWKASITMFLRNPILGVGIGGWKKEVDRMIDRKEVPVQLNKFNQTHNIYLDVLSTRGLIGLLTFMVLIFYPIVYAWKTKNITSELFRNTTIFSGIVFLVTGSADTLVDIRWSFLSYIALTGIGLSLLVVRKYDFDEENSTLHRA